MSKFNKGGHAVRNLILLILVLVFAAGLIFCLGDYFGWFDKKDNTVDIIDSTDDPDNPVDPDIDTTDDPVVVSNNLAYTLSSDGLSYSVSGIGTCTDTDVIIPSEYNGLPVTSIDGYAFYKCDSFGSIYIPDSITLIGKYAFYRCSLQEITFEDVYTWYCGYSTKLGIGTNKSIGVNVTHEMTVHYITDMYADRYWFSIYDDYYIVINGVSVNWYDTFYYTSEGFYCINNQGEKIQIYSAEEASIYFDDTFFLCLSGYYIPVCSDSIFDYFILKDDEGSYYHFWRFHMDEHSFVDGVCEECCLNETTGEYEHEYTVTVVDVTCTEDGYTLYTCSNLLCGYSYRTDYVDATGHTYVNGVCSVCGDEYEINSEEDILMYLQISGESYYSGETDENDNQAIWTLYNGNLVSTCYVYYLDTDSASGSTYCDCYYINSSGEKVYVYTTDDIDNGLNSLYLFSDLTSCSDDYVKASFIGDSGGTYLCYYVSLSHDFVDGICSVCGAAE